MSANVKKKNSRLPLPVLIGIIAAVLIIVGLIIFLPIWRNMMNGPSLPVIKYDEKTEKYVFSDEGIVYTYSTVSYEPKSIYRNKPFAVFEDGREAYEIPGLSRNLWMADDYYGVKGLFYNADKITLPTIGEFHPVSTVICTGDAAVFGLYTVEDQQILNELVDAIVTGEQAVYPADALLSYDLRFTSEEYPCIYYVLNYIICDGKYYIRDRGTNRTVRLEKNILADYVDESLLAVN